MGHKMRPVLPSFGKTQIRKQASRTQRTIIAVAVAAALTGYTAVVQAQSYLTATVSSVKVITAPAIHGHVMSAEGLSVQGAIIRLEGDRKSTRLNSSHVRISYAVFCLKKKKKHIYFVYFTLKYLYFNYSI